jgi:hypothetical protein
MPVKQLALEGALYNLVLGTDVYDERNVLTILEATLCALKIF